MAEMIERRRTPRVELEVHETVRLELRHRVQLLDISQSGALLGSDTVVPVGARGQLRAGLGAAPFHVEIDVRRHQTRKVPKGQVGLGTQFAGMDERSRQNLDQFLRRGKD
ncbi:MAG TPA: PilZ domain-containing protein [Vicinamibacterales bacterium]